MSYQQRRTRGLLCLKESLSADCNNLQPSLPNQMKGRDQHLEAGGPSGPIYLEPVKDRRRHGEL
jgi:hypothetical protein